MNKKLLYTLSLVVVIVAIIPLISFAKGQTFFISPTRVELSTKERVQVVNLTNLSNQTNAYEIRMSDVIMTEDGITKGIDDFEYSAKRMVRYVPRDFVLKPNERQAIRIMTRVPADTPDGDYHSHIMFFENIKKSATLNEQPEVDDTKLSLSAEADYQTLIPIVISHGKVETMIGMKDVVISKGKSSDSYDISMILTRTGNGQGKALISTDYIAADGTVTNLSLRRTFHIYRELNQRKAKYTITLPENVSGGSIKLSLFDTPKKKALPIDTAIIKIQ